MNEKTQKLIPIIILNWNGEDDTIECLDSIIKSLISGFISVVIDNGSTPESLIRLKNRCKERYDQICFFNRIQISDAQNIDVINPIHPFSEETLVFIENGENLGFARGNNIGLKFAELINSEWVMFLNNDTLVHKNAFQELLKFINSNPLIKAVTPQIRYFKPDTRIWNCGGKLTYWGSRKYYFADKDHLSVPQTGSMKITFITGCALLCKHTETGPFTEKYFFGEEDYEFSLRMKKYSFDMACVLNSIIYHKVGCSIKKLAKQQHLIYIQYISRLINTRDYYSSIRWQITRALSYLYIPVLLFRNKINPLNSAQLIRRINFYVSNNNKVDEAEYKHL
jgi:hypothetical protein